MQSTHGPSNPERRGWTLSHSHGRRVGRDASDDRGHLAGLGILDRSDINSQESSGWATRRRSVEKARYRTSSDWVIIVGRGRRGINHPLQVGYPRGQTLFRPDEDPFQNAIQQSVGHNAMQFGEQLARIIAIQATEPTHLGPWQGP